MRDLPLQNGIGVSWSSYFRSTFYLSDTEFRLAREVGGAVTPCSAVRRLSVVEQLASGVLGMELAGLEPATSWVRSRRSPN